MKNVATVSAEDFVRNYFLEHWWPSHREFDSALRVCAHEARQYKVPVVGDLRSALLDLAFWYYRVVPDGIGPIHISVLVASGHITEFDAAEWAEIFLDD